MFVFLREPPAFCHKSPVFTSDASVSRSRTQVQTYDKRCEHKKFIAGLEQCHPDIAVVKGQFCAECIHDLVPTLIHNEKLQWSYEKRISLKFHKLALVTGLIIKTWKCWRQLFQVSFHVQPFFFLSVSTGNVDKF